MATKKISSLVAIVLLVISACSSTPVHFDLNKHASTSTAVVYIYRPNSLSNVMVSPDVMIGDTRVFPISNNYYHVVHLPEGKHQVKLELSDRYKGSKEASLDVVAGNNYFLKVSSSVKFQMNQPYDRRFNLEQVSARQAQDEIMLCKPYMPDNKESGVDAVKQEAEDVEYSSQKFKNPFSK